MRDDKFIRITSYQTSRSGCLTNIFFRNFCTRSIILQVSLDSPSYFDLQQPSWQVSLFDELVIELSRCSCSDERSKGAWYLPDDFSTKQRALVKVRTASCFMLYGFIRGLASVVWGVKCIFLSREYIPNESVFKTGDTQDFSKSRLCRVWSLRQR